MIHDSGRHALHIINLSLDMYKMEQGIYQLNPRAIDLVPLISNLCRDRVLAHGRNTSVTILLHGQLLSTEDLFLVFWEETLCYSLFSNLIQNALDASPDEQPIQISLDFCDTMASIAIHNAGAVPVAIRERFFEKYATSGKRFGTGLGTYSVRLMTEAQRGSVYMQTSEEHGTIVTVQLPTVPKERFS